MVETGRVLVTAPTELPVSRSLAKEHLRDEAETAQDDAIDQIIRAATDAVEQQLWRRLITQTWDFYFSDFPAGCFELPLPPLQLVSSIQYTDPAGVVQTLDTADYQVDASSDPGVIAPAYGVHWPSVRSGALQAVKVRAVIGYGNAAKVPPTIVQAILLTIGDFYENRESAVVGTIVASLPVAASQLLRMHTARPWVG